MPYKRLPRDLDGDQLVRALRALGYETVRQTGSHVRVRTVLDGEHHETIPMHSPLKLGTLSTILANLQRHHGLTREKLLELLDL